MQHMADNSNEALIESQRKVIAKLQEEILEQPLFQPEQLGNAVEAQVTALRKLEGGKNDG
jgi:hypothetical protein